MASIYNQVFFHWLDFNGRPATTFWTTLDQSAGGAGDYSSLATAAQALCSSALIAIQFQQTLMIEAEPASGPYASVLDRCFMSLKIGETGERPKLALPGPKDDIWLPGNVILNLEDSRVVDLVSAMGTTIGNTGGDPITEILRGNRQRARGGP